MTSLSAVGAIVVATFHQMRRDRSVVVFLVLLPIGLMVLMGNIYETEDDGPPRIAVHLADDDRDALLTVDALSAAGSADLLSVDDIETLDDMVRRRRVIAGLTFDAGTAIVVGAPDIQLPSGVRAIVQGAVTRVDAARALASPADDVASIRTALGTLPAQVPVAASDGTEARTQAAIGVLVLVTFMNLLSYASLVPSHRSVGVFGRLAAAPVSRSIVLAGYAATFVVVSLCQVASALVGGRVLVGIGWGSTPLVVLTAVGLAVAAGGVATLVATLLPAPESGSTIGGPVGFALGMLGGCLWPLDFVGGILETIGRWIPHQWAVEAFRTIAAGNATLASLTPALGGLLLVGGLGAAIGSVRLAASWR